MYITTGTINSLFSWFNNNYNYSQFICIFAALSTNDVTFIKDMFKQKELIDLITGKNIDFFLFANKQDSTLAFGNWVGRAEHIPGDILIDSNNGQLWKMHISEIREKEVEENIVKASITIADQVCNFFNLQIMDLPSLIILHKGDNIPWIIHTRNMAEFNTFFNFLKELRILTDRLPSFSYNERSQIKYITNTILTNNQKLEIEKKIEILKNDLKHLLFECKKRLLEYNIPNNIAETITTNENAINIWKIMGSKTSVAARNILSTIPA